MKRLPSIALLAAGKIRDSFLKRVPRVEERLGPVRSSSYRLASRISNLLGAGHPVETLEEFVSCPVILLSMPENWLPRIVDELLESPIDWKSKTVLLCNSKCDSVILQKLAFVGAATGSLTPVDGFEERVFLAEGDRKAIRCAKLLVARPGVKVVTMDPGRKSLYCAGMNFATSLALPLIAASAETLRSCGIDQNEALAIADRSFQRTLRAYLKGGRKAWEGQLLVEDQEGIRTQLQALLQLSPQLASYFFVNAVQVVQMFRRDPKWLSEIEEDVYPKAASQ